MTESTSFNDAVRELASEVIAERASALAAAGLRATVEVRRWTKNDIANSELRITFSRGNAFVDVVEDFIIQDGTAAASLVEFRRWLEQSVGAILEESPEE